MIRKILKSFDKFSCIKMSDLWGDSGDEGKSPADVMRVLLEKLAKRKKWVAIAELIDEDPDKNFDIAIDVMSTNKMAQKACQYITRYGKNHLNYPKLM